jgi:SAM-dependent methyltransferase
MTWEEAVIWLRSQPNQIGLVNACFLDDPLIEAANRFYQSEEWSETRRYLPSVPGRVLDIGAGRGISSYALAKDGWTVSAIEPDPSPLVGADAIRTLSQISDTKIEVFDYLGEKLPFENNYFDAIYARQVLHHTKSLDLLCLEIARVLKPGGIFIATREHVFNNNKDYQFFLNNHPLYFICENISAFSLQYYFKSFVNAGLLFKNIIYPFNSPINYYPATKTAIEKFKNTNQIIFSNEYNLFNSSDNGLYMYYPGIFYSFVLTKYSFNSNNVEHEKYLLVKSDLIINKCLLLNFISTINSNKLINNIKKQAN